MTPPLVLRSRLQTRLGMPSIGELWWAGTVIGYVSCTSTGVVLSVMPGFALSVQRPPETTSDRRPRAIAIAIDVDEGTPGDAPR